MTRLPFGLARKVNRTAVLAYFSAYIALSSILPGIPVANAITPPAPTCNGLTATIYVDGTNHIVGGPGSGHSYTGTLNGTSGNDVIVGTSGDDHIDGKGGNDTICSLAGNDHIDSGNGSDWIMAGNGNNHINTGNGADTVIVGDGNNQITTGTGPDTVTAGNGNNDIDTDKGNDKISVGNGNNHIDGGFGTNYCSVGTGHNTISNCNLASSTTVVVKPIDLQGWSFTLSDASVHGSFVTGPSVPPIGSGSVRLQTGADGDQYVLFTNGSYTGVKLSDVTSLSYSTYVANNQGEQAPYLSFKVDYNGDNVPDDRIYFEPVYQNGTYGTLNGSVVPNQCGANPNCVSLNTWQTWNALTGGWWSLNESAGGPPLITLAKYVQEHPNARIMNDSTGGVRLIAGAGAPAWNNFDGNVDKLTIGVNFQDKTYDFEPTFVVPACDPSNSFDTFSDGSVNGQGGWQATGATYDQAVVDNDYGYSSFGCKSLRVSNAVTSGSFGDWIFAPPLSNSVGEAAATAGTFSEGTRQNHYEVQFDIASADPTQQQTGLQVSVSPDRGDGSRMSYLRFEDQSDGIHVFFDDVTDPTFGSSATFNQVDVTSGGGLDRAVPHTIKLTFDAVNGSGNDVVNVYIDGVLVHTGTSWEDYYRNDPEASAEQSPRLIKTLIIQARSGAGTDPAALGEGFLFDNFSLTSSMVPGNLHIMKYACPAATTVDRADNGPDASGNVLTVPAGCTAEQGDEFGYTYQADKGDNSAPYVGASDATPFTSVGTTDANGEISVGSLPALGRYNVAELNGDGSYTYSKSGLLGLFCTGDTGSGNDNYDIAFVPPNGTAYCVAYNVSKTVAAPTLLSPANGSYLTSTAFDKADWTDVTDPSTPVTYIYQSSNSPATNPDGSFVSPVYTSGPLTDSEIPTPNTPEGVYYWHVQAKNNIGTSSNWSDTWMVTVDNTAPQVLFDGYRNQDNASYDNTQPIRACGTTNNTGFVAFEWHEIGTDNGSPVSYEYKITAGPTAVGYTQIHTDTHHNGQVPTPGTYTVQITPSDAAGNVGTPVTCDMTYDPNYTDPVPSHNIQFIKYACYDGTTVSRAANGPDGSGNVTVPAGCWPEADVEFGYIHQAGVSDYSAPYIGYGDSTPYTSAGKTNANGKVLVTGLDDTGRYDVAVLNGDGSYSQTKPGLAGFFCAGTDTGDGTNNYEIAFAPHDGTTYCVAYDTVGAQCVDTSSNLVAHWNFDENTGTGANDSAGANDSGTINGAAWSTDVPTLQSANLASLSFNGVSDHVTVGDVSSLEFDTADSFSASAWVKPSSFSGYQTIIHKIDDTNSARRGYLFTLNNGVPEVWILHDFGANNYLRVAASTTLALNSWQQISFSYDGSGHASGVKIYVNGVDVTGAAVVDALSGTIQNSKNFEIGYRTDAAVQPYAGLMDDVRVYDSVLTTSQMGELAGGSCSVTPVASSSSSSSSSSSEVSSAATSSVISSAASSSAMSVGACTTTDIAGYWKLDEGSGTNTVDSTGLAHDGTLQNGPLWTTGTPLISPNTSAVSFDGSDDFISVANSSDFNYGTHDFTISAFVKTTSGNKSVLGNFNGSAPYRGWGLYIYNNNAVNFFGYGDQGSNDASQAGGTVLDGSWHNLVGVYHRSGNQLTIDTYVDGVLAGSHTATVGDISANSTLLFGHYLAQPNFNGSLDDIRIYSRALSSSEIASINAGCTNVVTSSSSSSQSSSAVSSAATSSVASSESSSSAPHFFGFTSPQHDDNGNGGYHGHQTDTIGSALHFLSNFFLGGHTAPGGFGGVAPGGFGGATTFTGSEHDLICSTKKVLPANTTEAILEWAAGVLAQEMGKSQDAILKALKDSNFCPQPRTHQVSNNLPIPFHVSAAGYPLSSNPTWNACIQGNVTLQDIRNNPDKDEHGNGLDCAAYHNGDLWKQPDLNIFFTWNPKTKTVTLPNGYVIVNDAPALH